MAKKRKFRRGRRITDVATVARLVEQRKWVFWGDRPMHPSWFSSMQLQTIIFAVKRGLIYAAVPNVDEAAKLNE